MNLNDQSRLYFIFDLTPLPLKLHNNKSPVRRGNECHPNVDELQRHFAVATKNIDTPCGKELVVIDSAPIPNSSLVFSANSRSPPLINIAIIPCLAGMQLLSRKLHIKKYDSGGTK